jgi:cytochrome c-type biogenesis protein CcmH
MLERCLLGLALALMLATASTSAKEASDVAGDPVLEARVMALGAELRCLVCQNQTIADSHAELAVDLRNQIRTQMQQGRTEDQIRDYMTARYGDFVLYKPPLKPATLVLWIGPAVLMLSALVGLFLMLRARQRARPEDFDPEPLDEPNPHGRT